MGSANQISHDTIREYAKNIYINKARKAKMRAVSFTANNIHSALSLVNRYPAVCRAIDSDIFKSENNLKLINRTGPLEGVDVAWTFELS